MPYTEPVAEDFMRRQIVAVWTSSPLSEVERLLADHRISGMPVLDSHGHAVGMVSFRDLLDRYVEDPDARQRRAEALREDEAADESPEDRAAREDTAETIMDPEVVHVPATATAVEVARVMVDHSIHRVLVTDPASGRVVGLVGALDLLGAFAR